MNAPRRRRQPSAVWTRCEPPNAWTALLDSMSARSPVRPDRLRSSKGSLLPRLLPTWRLDQRTQPLLPGTMRRCCPDVAIPFSSTPNPQVTSLGVLRVSARARRR
jgi:hypothetical protein